MRVSRFIEDVAVHVPSRGRYERLPDGRTTVVVRAFDETRGDVCVVGPRTRALFKDTTDVARAVIVQLRPGWSVPLLGVDASALTDHIVPLGDVWGRPGADLGRELVATRRVSEVVDRLARALAERAQQGVERSSARLARRAVRLIEDGEPRIEAVAARLGVTARHLRRAFAENIGVGPKELARAVRLSRAVRLAAISQDWARIATTAGYYDQAHLIADFRDLVGVTPTAFLGHRDGRAERLGG